MEVILINEIKGCIPNSVTHLTFWISISTSQESIPNSITHLTILHDFHGIEHISETITIKNNSFKNL